ncbi:hypothetical protein M0R04_02840 [Candidatus Dojkabacteria bacterium]|jgi:hypothetical protein|nr:hypothetical protein [Candidatus Dojkabacteria bacterium]
MKSRIPKKFSKTKKTFVDRISNDINSSPMSSFCAFPPEITFNGQDDKEDIVLLTRQHPAVYILKALLVIFLLFSPIILYTVLNSLLEGKMNMALWMGGSLVFILLAITVSADSFFKWFYSVNIITDERIVDVDFSNILYHKFAEAQLEKIEDVSHKPVGLLSTVFDFGDVYIQTAGTKPEFVFDSVPRPRDVQDTLLDLLELKENKKI